MKKYKSIASMVTTALLDDVEVWNTKEAEKNTYSLQGMATSNGYLIFGNDFNRLSIVK